MLKQESDLVRMVTEVTRTFEILGYKVSLPLFEEGDDENLLVERLNESDRFLVACLPAENTEKLHHFNSLVSKAREQHACDYGLVITNSPFPSPQPQGGDGASSLIKFMNIEELRVRLFNGQAYLQTSLPLWQTENRIFVDRRGENLVSGLVVDKLQDYLYNNSLAQDGSFTVLLGGIGSGKSTQLRQVAIKLCQEYLERGTGPIPLYIPLERFRPHRKDAHLDAFIVDYLNHLFYSPGPPYNWAGLKHRLSSGQILLLLDGFDEIGGLNTIDQINRELKHILSCIGITSKCVLTCRSNFLENQADIERVFSTELKAQYPALDVNLIELKPFGKSDIREYLIKKRVGPSRVINEIVEVELCERPLLLNLLTDTLSVRGRASLPKTEEQLVEQAVTFILSYCSTFFEAQITLADWREFLEYSALEMYRIGKRFLESADLEELLEDFFKTKLEPSELVSAKIDARVRTLYELDEQGLTFAHLEFRDFLAAFALAKRLLRPQSSDARLEGPIGEDILRFIPFAISKSKNIGSLRTPEKGSSDALPHSKQLKWRWIASGLSIVSAPGEGPIRDRLVYFPQGFWISLNPITIGDLTAAANAFHDIDYFPMKDFSGLDPNTPLTNVTYEQARRLCRDLFNGRLPTEEEWERAARWVDGSYPRYAQIGRSNRFQETPPSVDWDVTPNPWGVKNVSGCVWQWTSTVDPQSLQYVCKGAWWGTVSERKLDGSTRLIPTEDAHIRTGFRVVFDNREDLSR